MEGFYLFFVPSSLKVFQFVLDPCRVFALHEVLLLLLGIALVAHTQKLLVCLLIDYRPAFRGGGGG